MKLHIRIISVFLAFLVILSSSGIAVSKHLCNGELKDMAINTKAESCNHAASATIKCPIHKDMVLAVETGDKGCCEDTNQLIKEDADQITSSANTLPNFEIVFLYSYAYASLNISQHFTQPTLHSVNLKIPPLIHREIPIEVQSFLL